MTFKYNIFNSFVPLIKYQYVTYKDDNDKPLKLTINTVNGFVRCDGKTGDLLYITFRHSGMSNLGLYHEDINTEHLFLVSCQD